MAPDADQLGQLATFVANGDLQLAPKAVTLTRGPEAFDQVTAGAAGGAKYVLTF